MVMATQREDRCHSVPLDHLFRDRSVFVVPQSIVSLLIIVTSVGGSLPLRWLLFVPDHSPHPSPVCVNLTIRWHKSAARVWWFDRVARPPPAAQIFCQVCSPPLASQSAVWIPVDWYLMSSCPVGGDGKPKLQCPFGWLQKSLRVVEEHFGHSSRNNKILVFWLEIVTGCRYSFLSQSSEQILGD